MTKEKYIIRFADGTFLKKGTPKHFNNGTSEIAQVKTISDARIFSNYAKAEDVMAVLINFFMMECEITN